MRFLLFPSALLVVLSLAAPFAAARELPVVNVAYHPNLHGAAVVALGEEKGYFEEAGIRVRASRFTSGPPEVQALIAGRIDVGFIGTGALPLAMEGRAVVVAVDLIGFADEVIARPGAEIDDPADLSGKKVITTYGTSGEMILRVALARADLDIEEVTVVNAPPQSAVAAFTAGETDAIALWQPLTHQVRKQVPDARLITSGRRLYPEMVFPIVWVANRDFARERPDLLRRFLHALRKGIDYRAAHLDETIALVARYADVPREDIESQRDSAKFLTSAEFDERFRDGTAERWFAALAELFVDMERLDEPPPVEEFFDPSYFLEAPSEVASGESAAARDEPLLTPVSLLVSIAVALGLALAVFYVIHRRS